MKLVVLGEPRPLLRHRQTKAGRTYDPKENRIAKDSVIYAWREAGSPVFERDRPLGLKMVCYFDRPKSHFGTGRNAGRLKDSAPPLHCLSRIDGDNALKLILDALNGLAWHDDRQVADARVTKLWAPPGSAPQTVVEVQPLR